MVKSKTTKRKKMTTKHEPAKKPVQHEPAHKHPEPPVQVRPAPPPPPPPPTDKPPDKPHVTPDEAKQALIDIWHYVGDRHPTSAGIKQIIERILPKGELEKLK